MKVVDVTVSLDREQATIKILERVKLFDNPAKRFIIEADMGGFSGIEKRQDGYYHVNYSNARGDFIDKRKLTEKETIDLIKDVLKAKLVEE